jgi:choloylglycine hydrolase
MCQSFLLKSSATTPDYVVGRSMEFAPEIFLNWRAVKVPVGEDFSSNFKDEQIGMTWQNEFKYIGIAPFGGYFDKFIDDNTSLKGVFSVDGINEKGLSAGMLWYDANMKWNFKKSSGRDIWEFLFVDWLLGCCDTVQTVKNNILGTQGGGAINIFAIEFNQPVHFIVHDSSGDSVIIEIDNESINLYDKAYWEANNLKLFSNTLQDTLYGQMTNAPNMLYHYNNLRQYLYLNPHDIVEPSESSMSQTSHGSGMVGLPGDYSAPSRFVRLSNLLRFANQPADRNHTIRLANHFLNIATIVPGVVIEETGKTSKVDVTDWVNIKVLTGSPLMYCRLFDNAIMSLMYKIFDFKNFPTMITYDDL